MTSADKIERLVHICYTTRRRPVMAYLKSRKMTKEVAEQFRLGCFPASIDDLIKELGSEFLVDIGVLYKREDSARKLYSPFQIYPLIIPIRDVNGKFVGIAGRSLASEAERKASGAPKYINSQYDKANHLFGLNHAKQAIREKNQAIVVEGYFDVITSHQAGIKNVVATLGTFFSARQTLLLARYCEKVRLLFDADEAGQRAADRCRIVDGLNFERMYLPKGFKDIDEYIADNKNPDLDLF